MTNPNARKDGLRSAPQALALALLLTAVTASTALCDSLWDHRSARFSNLIHDSVAAEIGDSITVIIADRNAFTLGGKREMGKSSSTDVAASLTTRGIDRFDPLVGSEKSNRTFEGTSDYSLSRSFTDSITVTVVDKLPNGNLVVAGRAERDVAGETALTVLTGIVRPEDVTRDNTISSQRVSSARIYYEATGTSRAFLDQGWLNQIINYICPF